MSRSMEQTVAALARVSIPQLRAKYLEVFGEPSRSGNRDFLFKRVAWRVQSLAEGGLSERALRRAEELGRDSDVRTTVPRSPAAAPGAAQRRVTKPAPTAHDRLPIPGTVLTRKHRGKHVEVMVLPAGFEHDGQTYRSLSAVARAVTGSHWNGHLFFGLTAVRRGPKHEKRDMAKPLEKRTIRCAIYTRKSTEEGLEQAFNSLDAQRESGEACIAAQRHEGWVCLPDRYDDGGFSGGNIERPALRRLLADIEAGRIDCVIVYKVDRLSRSLMDFSRVMQVFEARNVSFASVTQQFNTTHSMGRLTLNILLSFAQFEREIISERTRDKIAAARRKGKWSGGKPLLGYDILSSPAGAKLVVNEDEALRVRQIFELYLHHQALIPTVAELAARGWVNKVWTTRRGAEQGGRPFDKTTLYRLLGNRTYTGVVAYQGQVYPGEHPAIVEPALFERVRAVLGRNGNTAGATVRNRYGALLKGLLRCACCRCAMPHTYSVKEGGKRYRYYVCLAAQKHGWDACPSKSVPAGEIERFVVDQIKTVGSDPAVLEGTLRKVRQQQDKALAELRAEQRAVERELARHHLALRKLAAAPDADRLADLNDRVQQAERRLTTLREQAVAAERQQVDPADVRAALASFAPVWEQLGPKEQARVVQLLVERVDYDGSAGTVAVTFRPTGIKALARENQHEVAA